MLSRYSHEFEANPHYAFTEMRAFQNFSMGRKDEFVSGMEISDAFVFDDCLCQGHGYDCITLPDQRRVKEIFFRDGTAYFGKSGTSVFAVKLGFLEG